MEDHTGRDWELFCRAGLARDYEQAGNYNLFMRCGQIRAEACRALPEGYHFRLCRREELETWNHLVVEPPYVESVAAYYETVYAKREAEFFRRCLFVCDSRDVPVASCFIWRAYETVNAVSWFRVLPEYEGRGLGRALLTEVLRRTPCPVYLHTQPTSVCAIKLYSDFGFELLTDPVIGSRKNHLAESLPYLKRLMPEADYARLQFTEDGGALHDAALSGETAEF